MGDSHGRAEMPAKETQVPVVGLAVRKLVLQPLGSSGAGMETTPALRHSIL
jgi:hypothetical protein